MLAINKMFVPLSHSPGHPQCDYGEARVIIGGLERKAHYFALDLPHSDGCYVKAYPAETTESFCDGHVSAFAFLGGVPQSILYDCTTLAVARILGDGRRQRTRVFSELQSHYLFEDRFGRPGKGNDKGKVEGLVGYVRRNFLVPIPSFESFDALNAHLEQHCLRRFEDRLRGHNETIGERLERDLEKLLPLPAVPYEASDKHATRVSSLSLVRYRTNDYSVPVAYGHRDVLVRGYVHEVVISCGSEVIARHRRSYDRDDFVFDPLHYLPLLERKTGALDQAAPLVGWELPEEFGILRRLLESRMGKRGKREFVQEGTFPERKALIRNFVESIKVVGDEATLTYTQPHADTAGYQRELLRYCAEGRDERFGVIEWRWPTTDPDANGPITVPTKVRSGIAVPLFRRFLRQRLRRHSYSGTSLLVSQTLSCPLRG